VKEEFILTLDPNKQLLGDWNMFVDLAWLSPKNDYMRLAFTLQE
jgi:hypothetical protein